MHTIIPLPAYYILFTVLPFGCMVVPPLCLFFYYHNAHSSTTQKKLEQNWLVPDLTTEPTSPSFFHRWDPRCKVIIFFICAFLVTTLQNTSTLFVALLLSIIALLFTKTSFNRIGQRVCAICGFMAMLMLVLPFSVPIHADDTIFIFGDISILSFNLRGATTALCITLKALVVILQTETLLTTSPLPQMLSGLGALGLPENIRRLILICHRYIYLFADEAFKMTTAMRVRGFRNNGTNLATFQATANLLGMLLVRSFERAERITDAMTARGYNGSFPVDKIPSLQKRDIIASFFYSLIALSLLITDFIF